MSQELNDVTFVGGAKPTGLPAPTDPTDAANKAYVDSAVEGISWKDAVRVASVANINLASPGATIDGITMAVNDRFLAKDQTVGAENGIRVFNGASSPATRAADASTTEELEQATVTVEEGTSSGTTYRQTALNFTLDTDPVTFTTFGTSAPDASTTQKGLVELATQAETDAGSSSTLVVTAQTLANYGGLIKKVGADLGDGTATQIDFVHNLNSLDVVPSLRYTTGDRDYVRATMKALDVNTTRLNFASAPATNSIRAIAVG